MKSDRDVAEIPPGSLNCAFWRSPSFVPRSLVPAYVRLSLFDLKFFDLVIVGVGNVKLAVGENDS